MPPSTTLPDSATPLSNSTTASDLTTPGDDEMDALFESIDLSVLARRCEYCGGEMIPRRSTRRTCSDRCRKRLSRLRQWEAANPLR